MGDKKLTRITVNLAADTADALQDLAARRKVSLTEGIRRAISVWKFAEDEIAKGNRLAVIEPDGKIREVVLL